jgi:hypothetical protein
MPSVAPHHRTTIAGPAIHGPAFAGARGSAAQRAASPFDVGEDGRFHQAGRAWPTS